MTKERFTVSAAGLRELHADREPWMLVKELVQNAWDEAPEATRCDVSIELVDDRRLKVTVTDDGPGFAEIEHTWTLMASTPKRADPKKRGRFNLGEKEIVAVAESAAIETVGTTVFFPPDGGRETTPNTCTRGTRVTVVMPWGREAAAELIARLGRFRPTDCDLTINGTEVPRRTPLSTRTATLRTLIQHGPGKPMTDSRRKTTVDVLERVGDEAWIYELGIPIQKTTLPYDIDVHQKVPMPPNRNTVSPGYLQDVMTEVLNAMHERMAPEAFSEAWVRSAIEDDRIEDKAVATVRKNRYGEKAVTWSSDTDANMRAAEAGYQVIHPKAMSAKERQVMAAKGGLRSAKKLFGRPAEKQTPVTSNEIRDAFARWVVSAGRHLGMKPSVRYVSAADATFMAQCSTNRRKPVMTINTHYCSDAWLARRGAEQLELVIHELAHALGDTPMEHGPRWGEAATRTGALLADAIARQKLQYDRKAPPTTGLPGLIGTVGPGREGRDAPSPTTSTGRTSEQDHTLVSGEVGMDMALSRRRGRARRR